MRGVPDEGGAGEKMPWSEMQQPWGDCGPKAEMHSDEALRRVKAGGSLLVLDFPEEASFGVNLRTWITGPRFAGLKMIPGGLHCVVWDAGQGHPQAMWVRCEPGSVVVRRWDASAEDLTPLSGEEEAARYAEGVRRFEFDAGLAPFPESDLRRWRDLTHFVTNEVLERGGIPLSAGGLTCHVSPGDPDDEAERDNRSRAINPYWGALARTISYTRIGTTRSARNLEGLSGEEKTERQMDASPLLEGLLARHYGSDPKLLLGEFQLSFASFLLLSSLPALEHWKRVINLLTSSGRAMARWPALFQNFVSAFEIQLESAPENWFLEEATADSFLREAFASLFERTGDLSTAADGAKGGESARPAVRRLVQRCREFFKFLERRFGVRVRKPPKPRRPAGKKGEEDGAEGGMELEELLGGEKPRVTVGGEEMGDGGDEESSGGPMVVYMEESGGGETEEDGLAGGKDDAAGLAGRPLRRGFFPAPAPSAKDPPVQGDAYGRERGDAYQEEVLGERMRTMMLDDGHGSQAVYGEQVHVTDGSTVSLEEEAERSRRRADDLSQKLHDTLTQVDESDPRARAILQQQDAAAADMRELIGGPDVEVREAEDGVLVDMRGEDVVVLGDPKVARSLVDVSQMERDFGKKVVFASEEAGVRRAWDDSAILPRKIGDVVTHGGGKDCVRGADGGDGWPATRTKDPSLSCDVTEPTARDFRGGKIDYSCFDDLSVSEEPKDEMPEIPMCSWCNFKRPADLEWCSGKNNTVLERLCSVCAEAAGLEGTPLKRMQWMLEEPEWFKNGFQVSFNPNNTTQGPDAIPDSDSEVLHEKEEHNSDDD